MNLKYTCDFFYAFSRHINTCQVMFSPSFVLGRAGITTDIKIKQSLPQSSSSADATISQTQQAVCCGLTSHAFSRQVRGKLACVEW